MLEYDDLIEDPSCDYHLEWTEKPDRILLMKKFRDSDVTTQFKEIAKWLIEVGMDSRSASVNNIT